MVLSFEAPALGNKNFLFFTATAGILLPGGRFGLDNYVLLFNFEINV